MEDNNKQTCLIIGPRGINGCEGGIEKFTDSFLPRALKYLRIDVLVLKDSDGASQEGLNLIKVPEYKLLGTDKALYILYALYYYVIKRYDHVYILGTNFSFLIPAMKLIFWRRAKIHLRSGSVDYLLDKWSAKMKLFLKVTEKFCLLADTVIAVSPSIKKHLESRGATVYLVRNGLDKTGSNIKQNREPNTILAVGRVTIQKNYMLLLKALSHMNNQALKTTIIGGADLSEENEIINQYINDNKDINVTLTGVKKRDFVVEQMRNQALYINCSIHEGMSNAILEAIQYRIPLVLSDIPENRDLNLADHIYFDLNNHEALADKISDALNAPEKYTVSADQFDDWDSAIDNMLQIMKVKK